MGAVSPFGVGVPILMKNLFENKSAVKNMYDSWKNTISDMNCWVGAPLCSALNEKSIPRKYRKTMGKTAIFSYIAANEALQESNIAEDLFHSGRMGISFSSSTGSTLSTWEMIKEISDTKQKRNLTSGTFFKIMSHTSAANLALAFNVKGRVISPDCACSSSLQAIGLGYEAIKHGIQDIMICGGSDELNVITSALFDQVNAASFKYNNKPQQTPRPFDKDRDGTVCGEGAGCIIIESEESALSRGAQISGEILSFSTISSGVHISNPDDFSILNCIQNAMKYAKLKPEDISYINAHATGTVIGDLAEAVAIKNIFGNKKIPISSLKGHIGHTLGASSVIETIATVNMIRNNTIIPTLNLIEPDSKCNDLFLIREKKECEVNICIKNSFAFGGINTVLIIRGY